MRARGSSPRRRLAVGLVGAACAASVLAAGALADQAKPIADVSLSAASFDPSAKDAVRIRYRLAHDERVTVSVFDPEDGLVRTLIADAPRSAGAHEETWDGKDAEGRVVPDEAYTFTIETASGAVYDPTTDSGGAIGHVRDVRFDREDGTVGYSLPAAARVLVRLGLHDGPLLRTLVDWKPRPRGQVTELWNGLDESELISVYDQKRFTALVTTVSLPDATVIASGNDRLSYRDDKRRAGAARPKKPQRERSAGLGPLRPQNLMQPPSARAPRLTLSFPKLAGEGKGIPEVRGAVDVRVDVDPADLQDLLEQQFEIVFFVDQAFSAEAERGYLPLNWRWETDQLSPGEHVLTVNLSSFAGQAGTASRKVRVLPPGQS